MAKIYICGTADTKGAELAYLADCIRVAGGQPHIVDVGTRAPSIAVDVSARVVATCHPEGAESVLSCNDRGQAVSAMRDAFTRYITAQTDIAAIIGIGGGGGTSIITGGLQALPLGLPKIMVSTLASGDVAPFVGVSDIIMMPSITDLAGLNQISRVILHNAAQAISAMALSPAPNATDRPALGLTMFGVTTPCVTEIARQLEAEYDCLIFHATGTGGRSLEKLADSGLLSGLIDVTTTEVCDLLFGGVLPATEDRFGAIARTKLPCVLSLGALDMVNFWAPETVPDRFAGRTFYHHNPNITLMRTTADECAAIGRWIGAKLNACDGPLRVLIPELGVSSLDIAGGAFFDPDADAALFSALESVIKQTDTRRVVRLPLHINDPEFASAAVAAFHDIALTGENI
ncbi:MAG: Tm-1-like ATP-binding domain-containing protein [Deltaproteobacteria bacterium]